MNKKQKYEQKANEIQGLIAQLQMNLAYHEEKFNEREKSSSSRSYMLLDLDLIETAMQHAVDFTQ